ncbi:MAG: acetyl-CoA C-acetyltransferase [Candidatus Eremiobacteraeota bacterium]|nr:acetyl-CoA C-acetyltransferase [Candidatus Eremiobacteraeota bacterium]
MPEAYIVAAVRTAGGRKGGKLAGWHPADLAAQVLDAVVARAGADPAAVDDVILGCVVQIGQQAMNVARNAVLASSLPESVPGTTIDRQCGSSQQALHFAAQAVMSGTMDVVIAGGVESMTRVPISSSTAFPAQHGMGTYKSAAMEDRYPGVEFSQFTGAEMMARKYDLSRDEIDQYSYDSHRKAIAATNAGYFNDEIVPLEVRYGDGLTETHAIDEGIRFDATLEAIQSVKLLHPEGRVTAASSSQICDGASAVLIANARGLATLGAQPLARIVHMSVLGHDPVIMLEAPIPATQRALAKAGLSANDIDAFEVNEAFAPVPLAWLKTTGADPAKLNVHGGAIALGHPLGSSGTKLMTTLLHTLRRRGGRYGLQTMCEGGGLANVTIVERLAS